MGENPYTVDGQVLMPGPNSRYAVPSKESGGPYITAFGWAPTLGTQSNGIPDAERLGVAPIRQRQVDPTGPPDAWFDRYTDFDDARRHTVETQVTEGQTENRTWGHSRAPDNRWFPVPASRVTDKLSPSQYLFTRPFQRPPARNNGIHFSMADHRRNYPILGMEPANKRRNTYRIDPTPWDAEVMDTVQAAAVIASVPTSMRADGRSYRAGG
jgi:hypothetical protein